ncbi:BigA/YdbA N-terminal beta-barrel domain-containing protein [Enterobacter sp. SA187]|uniref:BigA/YdbA N-terminal beta-barrel domain-containing protein n=1 Tax=Enterobacter sp. SA187 TaxID=1914861 RepID=UPI000934A234|nr:autotransporter outer membrane beta-barrel domain-containing protein [Enterobacter sp. SA187]
MQKKSVLSLCIAMALSGNSYAGTDLSEKERKSQACPANISALSEAQKAKLPPECLKEPSFLEEQWEWVAGGVAAVAAAVGLAAGGGGGGDGGDSGDDGSSTPTGDIIKTYSNGVTWNETKKTVAFAGITWNYTANPNGTYTLTDPATGKTIVLDKWALDEASNAVTMKGTSADGSKIWYLDITGEINFTDAVNWHEGNNNKIDTNGGTASGEGNNGSITIGDDNTINNNGDTNGNDGGTGTKVDGDGNTIDNNGNNSGTNGGTGTEVDGDGNAIDNHGTNTGDGEGSTGTDVDGNGNTIDNGGDNSGTNGGTGTDVNGDTNDINNDGNNSGTGGGTGTNVDGNGNTIDNNGDNTGDGTGSTGTDVDGNDNTINNNGNNSGINDGTGTDATGDNNDINNNGNNSGTGGGTGTKVDGDGNTIDNKGTNTGDGEGSTGTDVDGNGNAINNGGESSGTNGGTGTDVDGNGNTIDNNGDNTGDGTGSTGTDVDGNDNTINNNGNNSGINDGTGTDATGDNNDINNNGNNSGTGGGTGTKVDGDGNTIDNKGTNTGDGEGSTGTDVDGNGNAINNGGESSGTNGGTGTNVDGNGNTIDNNGDNTGDGTGSTGTDVDGNDNTINNNGNNSGINDGTGTDVTGDNNDINNNGGNNGANGGTGTKVDGNGNTIDNTGGSTATDGGTGTKVNGDDNIINSGDLDVSSTDSTKPSTGVDVAGNNNQINQMGKMAVGDFSTGINVEGNGNTLNLDSSDMSITGQQATGANVTGESNTVKLTGNMVVNKDQKSPLAADNFYKASTGINVSGSNNTVVLDGHLQVVVDSEDAGRNYANNSGSMELIQGATVTGDNNRVDIMKGIELTGEKDQLDDADKTANQRTGTSNASVVTVDGKSSVYVHGDSSVNGYFPVGINNVISVKNGGYLEFTEGSTFSTSGVEEVSDYNYDMHVSQAFTAKSGSTIANKGEMSISDMTAFEAKDKGSKVVNNGRLEMVRSELSTDRTALRGISVRNGATGVNQGVMTGKTVYQGSITNVKDHYSMSTEDALNNHVAAIELMTAYAGSSVINEGQLELYGRGTGMVANKNSTADNFGQITTDAMWKDAADTSDVRTSVPSGDNPMNYAVGMGAGSNAITAQSNSVATNRVGGTITVYNAGAGMVAYGSSNKAVNQGTINLEKNENYVADQPLVGMAVYGGATVVNDTTGVININAENGKAFYTDGNKDNRIINRGHINIGAGVPPEADNSDAVETPEFADGTVLSGINTLTETTSVLSDSTVSNTGTVNGTGRLYVEGTFNNQSSGIIDSPVSVSGTNGVINNSGTINAFVITSTSGKVVNNGSATGGAEMWGDSRIINSGSFTLGTATDVKDVHRLDLKTNSVFENAAGGVLTGDNNKNAVHLNNNGTFKNDKGATMNFTASSHAAGVNIWGGTGDFINDGTANATGVSLVASQGNAAAGKAFFWNQDDGVVNFTASQTGQSAVSLTHSNYVGVNDGTMNVSGSGAVGMKGSKNAQLVNNGTINLGTEGTTESGMVAMQLDANATADAVIENNGAINIYASNSYAFSKLGANGRIVNNGTVTLAGEGSGLIQQDVALEGNGTGGNGTETHAASYTLPTDPTAAAQSTGLRSSINQYTVGTSADGSAGTLTASHVDIQDVNVDTGFTAGTADTSVTFNDVFVGEDIQGEQNITSASVVWTAEGEKDASGNVDVTMTKNAYADVAGDASVNSVANALDAAYTSNELYNSLNLATSAELTSALKQISGSKATGVSRDARILSNRFDMLADTAPVMNNGLAFNVVAKGDKRAELGNDTTYDMLALRQSLAFGDNQTLTMEYGIARLDGDGNAMSAGDNGVTGGYSQFLGLKHSLPLTEGGLNWDNALRYDVHNFDSNRAVRYGDVNKTANADTRQQYMEFRTEGSKAFKVQEGLTVTPFAGLKMRHTMEDGYSEKGAGDFNLSMSSSSETAVDAVVGLKLSYAGEDGWAATASLEGGPNLSYAKSKRTASLAGARGQTFSVDDAQQGGGVNGQAMAGVKYSAGNAQFTADAFQWQEDGVKDKGFMLNYKYKF